MTRDEIFEETQEIFRDIFDDEELVITDETNADHIEDWDSLNHINLVTAIEKSLVIHFALGELEGLKNVGDMIELIIKKKAN
ncbi:acyl carrier protein [Candidatus Marinamargulisbacteria bacterium SCGC AAA071-K20]|nr:acyl carrier protein [Candidatus Marinamargulisbacteria bacterium SCGC AAA071-K20]